MRLVFITQCHTSKILCQNYLLQFIVIGCRDIRVSWMNSDLFTELFTLAPQNFGV